MESSFPLLTRKTLDFLKCMKTGWNGKWHNRPIWHPFFNPIHPSIGEKKVKRRGAAKTSQLDFYIKKKWRKTPEKKYKMLEEEQSDALKPLAFPFSVDLKRMFFFLPYFNPPPDLWRKTISEWLVEFFSL
jgi:hypothetical protein